MKDGGLVPGTWNEPTSHIDLAPTILDALGLAAPESFTGTVAGLARRNRGRVAVHWDNIRPELTWQVQNWKLFYRFDGSLRLYDRATDPSETTDLANEELGRVRELWDELAPLVERLEEIHPVPKAREPSP